MRAALLVLALAVPTAAQTHRWVFEPEAVEGRVVRAAAGDRDVRLEGNARVGATPVPGGLLLGAREDRAVYAPSLASAGLPAEAITVEAWVSVDRPRTWGGIVCAIQDDGAVEKGWLLGYRDDRFCFALSTEGADDGDGLLTYLSCGPAFAFGGWHHVAGTYDGEEMRLYVDGDLVAESAAQSGPILYPARAWCELGGYRDADEDFPLEGWIGEVAIHDEALTRSAVKRAHRRGSERWQVASPADSVAGGPVAEWHLDERLAGPSGLVDASGGLAVRLEGAASARWDEAPGRLVFDGDTAGARLDVPALPPHATTVEGFFLLHDADAGGPLLAAYEQTADGERGWVLDCRDSRFRFGLATSDGAPGLARVQNAVEVQPFRWYHLAATYDGGMMRFYVDGEQVAAGRGAFGEVLRPDAAQVTVAALDDLAGTHRAAVEVHRASLWGRALSAEEVRGLAAAARASVPDPLRPTWGPLARFVWPDGVVVEWGTAEPTVGVLEVEAPGGEVLRAVEDVATTEHRLGVGGLARETEHELRVLARGPDGDHASASWELDTSFHLHGSDPTRGLLDGEGPLARTLLGGVDPGPGWALLVGAELAALAPALGRESELQVVVAVEDPGVADALRREWMEQALYGEALSVHVGAPDALPYGDWTFDVVVAGEPDVEAVRRLARPEGGVLATRTGKGFSFERVGTLPGTDTWTHQYGDPANAAANDDALVKGPMALQWFGEPGPRGMTDRGARPPAPVSAGGRMYVQGLRRLFGLNAYNGTVLWTIEVPRLIRSNLPRDCSNMVCDEDSLWVAMDDHLFELDGATGATLRRIPTPAPTRPRLGDGRRAWGYVGVVDDLLLGSVCRDDAVYRATNGEWYDGTGLEAETVLGEELFALEEATGERLWTHVALFVQATVTVVDGLVLFVEEGSPTDRSLATGRLTDPSGDEALVALDLGTGEERWRRPVDLSAYSRTLYLSADEGVVLIAGTGDGYFLQAHDLATGVRRWQQRHGWQKDHHGGAMQHPVLTHGVVYSETRAFDLASGRALDVVVPPRRGCGTMSASADALFFRDYFHTMWEPATGARTDWLGFRSGCWLAMIPSGGLLLLPEASSGCSCQEPLQTSAAFRPLGALPE